MARKLKDKQKPVDRSAKKAKKEPIAEPKKTGDIPFLKIVLCLFFICTVCAGLLGATYLLTKNQILQNEKAVIDRTLESIYGPANSYEDVPVPEGQNATAIYLVRSPEKTVLGYAVRTTSSGYGGKIDLIVGFSADAAVRGINVISHAETSGLGSRATEQAYLEKFIGTSGEVEFGQGIDAISGATKSSRAMLNGVNAASECLKALGV